MMYPHTASLIGDVWAPRGKVAAISHLLDMQVELHVLADNGLGAVVCGRLLEKCHFGNISYEVAIELNGQRIAAGYFNCDHFEALTQGNVIWVRQ
jgi:hypothetical protein